MLNKDFNNSNSDYIDIECHKIDWYNKKHFVIQEKKIYI